MQPDDAHVSYKWRNSPRIWRMTGSRPHQYITPEMEREWLESVLKKEDQRRFAICLTSDNRYIGNIFLTDIRNGNAYIHVFVGELEYWGSGRVLSAIRQMIDYAFNKLDIHTIHAQINQHNLPSISLMKAAGFRKTKVYFHEGFHADFVDMEYSKETHFR